MVSEYFDMVMESVEDVHIPLLETKPFEELKIGSSDLQVPLKHIEVVLQNRRNGFAASTLISVSSEALLSAFHTDKVLPIPNDFLNKYMMVLGHNNALYILDNKRKKEFRISYLPSPDPEYVAAVVSFGPIVPSWCANRDRGYTPEKPLDNIHQFERDMGKYIYTVSDYIESLYKMFTKKDLVAEAMFTHRSGVGRNKIVVVLSGGSSDLTGIERLV